jgi:hypothetical protein
MLEGHQDHLSTTAGSVIKNEFSEPIAPSVHVEPVNHSASTAPVSKANHGSGERAMGAIPEATRRQRRRPVKVTLRDTQTGAIAGQLSAESSPNPHNTQRWPSSLSAKTDPAESVSDSDVLRGNVGGCSGLIVEASESNVNVIGASESNVNSQGDDECQSNTRGSMCLPLSSSLAQQNNPETKKIIYVTALEPKTTVTSAFGTSAINLGSHSTKDSALLEGGKQIDKSSLDSAGAEAACDSAFNPAVTLGLGAHSAAENARLAGILRAAMRAVAAASEEGCDDIRPRDKLTAVKANIVSRGSTPHEPSGWTGQCSSGYCVCSCSSCCVNETQAATVGSVQHQDKATETDNEPASPAAALATAAAASAAAVAAAAAASEALAKEKAKVA